jgi:hypothetical protein
MNTITEGKYIDLFATYRFLRILTIPWEDQEAFKLGIIDENGKRIKEKKLTTSDEKDAYTMLHRMVFNFKRILSKIPLVKSKLGTYAAALFLLKEHMKEDEYNLLVEYISDTGKFDDELTKNINKLTLTEALCLLEEENMTKALQEGKQTIEVTYDLETPRADGSSERDHDPKDTKKHLSLMKKFKVKISNPVFDHGAYLAQVTGEKKDLIGWMKAWGWDKEDIDDIVESAKLSEDAPTNNMGDGKIAKKDNVMKFDGRSKNFKSVMRRIKERKLKEQERLMKAKLLKWGIKEGVVNEEEYEAFFKKAMKKFKIKDLEDLNDKERVKFFNWIDKNWDAGENETD